MKNIAIGRPELGGRESQSYSFFWLRTDQKEGEISVRAWLRAKMTFAHKKTLFFSTPALVWIGVTLCLSQVVWGARLSAPVLRQKQAPLVRGVPRGSKNPTNPARRPVARLQPSQKKPGISAQQAAAAKAAALEIIKGRLSRGGSAALGPSRRGALTNAEEQTALEFLRRNNSVDPRTGRNPAMPSRDGGQAPSFDSNRATPETTAQTPVETLMPKPTSDLSAEEADRAAALRGVLKALEKKFPQ